MLSRDASEWAAEIQNHDWSDAPFRTDRAGHKVEHDKRRLAGAPQLEPSQAEAVRLNVIFIALQVLTFREPQLDALEFARAAGDHRVTRGVLDAGLRKQRDGSLFPPGVPL